MNLPHNATKYTPQAGRIALTVEREGEYAVICVRDSEIGIPPARLGKVFDMFSQVAPMAERSQGGLGIGLALAHSIGALHGGTIEARSEGSGRGSELTVRLPVVAGMRITGATPAAQQTGAGTAGRRIVVIDDNQEAAESLAMLLELEGHAVRAAADGLTGLQLAGDINAEAVLLDIGLPGIDGFEVARRSRREPWGKHLLLVAISAWSQVEHRQQASSAGLDHFLTKPVSLNELNALLPKSPAVDGRALTSTGSTFSRCTGRTSRGSGGESPE
ncbi:response regulator [Paraburkholderia graminis]